MSRFFAGGIVKGGGGGSFGPVYMGHASLKTPGGAAVIDQSNKLFNNLPLDTKHNKVEVHLPNKLKKMLPQSTKVREELFDTNKQYSDSFVTHPVKGNYQEIIKTLNLQREESSRAVQQSATLESVAAAGYRNLGETADEQKKNDMRDRLLYAGASLDQIEEILAKTKHEQLMAMAKLPLSPEQKAVLAAEERIKRSVVEGAEPGGPEAYRPPEDANVFNFRMPGAGAYALHPAGRRGPEPPSIHEVLTTRYSPALLARRRAAEANAEGVTDVLALPVEGRNGVAHALQFTNRHGGLRLSAEHVAELQTHRAARGIRGLQPVFNLGQQARQVAQERPAMFGVIAEVETVGAVRRRLGELPPDFMRAVPQLRNRGAGRPRRDAYHAEVAAPYPRPPTQSQVAYAQARV